MASDTRERLVKTTGRLLRQQGYAGTGLNQVMAEADAPKGSMYFHFPGGKEELAAAAVERFGGLITRQLEAGLARGSAADAVMGFFDAYIEHVEQTEFRDGCAVATVALDEASTHPLLAEAAGHAVRSWVDVLAQAFEAEGSTSSDAHDVATLVIAAIEGAIVMAKAERSSEPFAAARDALHRLLADGRS